MTKQSFEEWLMETLDALGFSRAEDNRGAAEALGRAAYERGRRVTREAEVETERFRARINAQRK